MRFQVHGKHIEIGAALRAETEPRIAAAVGKYFDREASGTPAVSRDNHEFRFADLRGKAAIESVTALAYGIEEAGRAKDRES